MNTYIIAAVVLLSLLQIVGCHDPNAVNAKPKIPFQTELRQVPKWSPRFGSDHRVLKYQTLRKPILDRHKNLTADPLSDSGTGGGGGTGGGSDGQGIPREGRPTLARHLEALGEALMAFFR